MMIRYSSALVALLCANFVAAQEPISAPSPDQTVINDTEVPSEQASQPKPRPRPKLSIVGSLITV